MPDGTKALKLGDFGLATEAHSLLYTVCGTPTYVAPEVLGEVGYVGHLIIIIIIFVFQISGCQTAP